MSLIIFMETNEGMLIAADSRLSRKTDPNWHRDDAYKLFECGNRIGIAYHGDADINGEPMDRIIMKFLSTVEINDTFHCIVDKMQSFIKSKGNPVSKFYLFGYDNDKRLIAQFNVSDNSLFDMSDAVHGTGGNDEIAWPFLHGKLDIHDTNEEAIALIDYLFSETIAKLDTVGGPIDILLVAHKGTQWIRRK